MKIVALSKPTAKSVIISILANEWPLSVKRIYNKSRKMNVNMTYQAIHKAIMLMLVEEIIIRSGRDYSINPEWVKRNKYFYEELEMSRIMGKRMAIEEIMNRSLTEVVFDNLYDFYAFTLSVLEKIVERSTGKVCVNEVYHMYWTLTGSKREQEQFKKILSLHPKTYFLCRGDTFVDDMLAKFYGQFGAMVKMGEKCAENNDIMAGGGYVIQVFFDKMLKERLDGLYGTINEKAENLVELHKHLFSEKTLIKVIIKKDPELAGEIIDNVLKRFESYA